MKKYIIIISFIAVLSITAVITYTKETTRNIDSDTIQISVNNKDYQRYVGISELLH